MAEDKNEPYSFVVSPTPEKKGGNFTIHSVYLHVIMPPKRSSDPALGPTIYIIICCGFQRSRVS